jgi:myosin heavy subunit
VDDKEAWDETIEAMHDVGISHEGVLGVQRVVTLCLLLGQLRFGQSVSDSGSQGTDGVRGERRPSRASVSFAKILSRDELINTAALAGVDAPALEAGLTIRRRWAGKEVLTSQLR